MKNLNVFMLLITTCLFIGSCAKESNYSEISVLEDGQYKYSKIINLEDGNGNTAEVEIFANEHDNVIELNSEDLEFVTTTQIFENYDNQIIAEPSDSETSEAAVSDLSNKVFINVNRVNLNEGITGFRVTEKKKLFSEENVENRASGDRKEFGYGANDVNGAFVDMTYEKWSECSIKVDVDFKKYSSTLFYSNWDEGDIYSPSYPPFNQSTSQINYKYRLDINVKGKWGKCDNDSNVKYNWWWLYF